MAVVYNYIAVVPSYQAWKGGKNKEKKEGRK